MKFTKMQGCGNDYLYINGFEENICAQDKPELVRRLSDRHFGVGGDGVIFINPNDEADFEMEMYNADGSKGKMCGNGIRCVGKYVYDKGLTENTHLSIASAGQINYLELMLRDNEVDRVRVNMGSPVLDAPLIPVRPDLLCKSGTSSAEDGGPVGSDNCQSEYDEAVINRPMEIMGKLYRVTCVSMGNPHAVIFTDHVKDILPGDIGPAFEKHEAFPDRVNTEFVEVIDRRTLLMRVWERGSGETLACGTGCCAAVVAGVLNGLTDDEVNVRVPGGELLIKWDRDDNQVFMTGPARTVFEGEIDL